MAAIIYLTVCSPSTGSATSLVCSKTKVAPLKKLIIFRLELATALLFTKLMSHVQATLKLKINSTHLSRVAQIQQLSTNAGWRYVHGGMNPADCASQGVWTDQFIAHPL
ncbi:hypothetical protein P5V15_010168 [Pogonomyrmex californicus]